MRFRIFVASYFQLLPRSQNLRNKVHAKYVGFTLVTFSLFFSLVKLTTRHSFFMRMINIIIIMKIWRFISLDDLIGSAVWHEVWLLKEVWEVWVVCRPWWMPGQLRRCQTHPRKFVESSFYAVCHSNTFLTLGIHIWRIICLLYVFICQSSLFRLMYGVRYWSEFGLLLMNRR